MNKPKINTDKVITTIKKTLSELRDVDFASMTDKERVEFREGFKESEDLAHAILSKIDLLKKKE